MRLTVPHFHHFGSHRELVGDDLVNPGSWDRLRLEAETIFSFDATRDAWDQRIATDAFQRRRAAALVSWLEALGVRRLASYGVGPAPIERWINRLRPHWELHVTDYAPRTVERLRSHFPEARTHLHDLRRQQPLPADAHLLCCLDTEFSDEEWLEIYERFSGERLIVYPCATLGPSTIVNELRQWVATTRPTRCGFVRTRGQIEAFLGRTHNVHRLSRGGRLGAAWLATARPEQDGGNGGYDDNGA
jgi:hypothetical protein